MRLDVFLFERGLVSSRTEAKNFITSGAVKVYGKVVTKPAFEFSGEESELEIDRESKKYASRAGAKLEAAINCFKISVEGRLALDIGASSGGFTDCLLQYGASHVIAVDSGYGQLADFLRKDPRVTVVENYNARYMKSEDLEYSPDICVMDVSFISSTYIIPQIAEVIKDGGVFVCLVKPQFEVGKAGLGKGGIVKDEKTRRSALNKVISFAESFGFKAVSNIDSPIRGGDGNVEYLVHFVKEDVACEQSDLGHK